MLSRLIYTSTARPDLDLNELRSLLRTAQRFNSAANITGLLALCKGQFLQALEGEAQALNNLYLKILQDPRHFKGLLLQFRSIESRCFDHWSMQLIDLDRNINAERKSALIKHTLDVNSPFSLTPEAATAFLLDLQALELQCA